MEDYGIRDEDLKVRFVKGEEGTVEPRCVYERECFDDDDDDDDGGGWVLPVVADYCYYYYYCYYY